MFKKTFHATHPDMMKGAGNDDLRDRYLVQDLFAADTVSLNYSHNERFVIGGAAPVSKAVKLPARSGANWAWSMWAGRARSPSTARASTWRPATGSISRWARWT